MIEFSCTTVLMLTGLISERGCRLSVLSMFCRKESVITLVTVVIRLSVI